MTTDGDGQELESILTFNCLKMDVCSNKYKHKDKLVTSLWHSLNICATCFLITRRD